MSQPLACLVAAAALALGAPAAAQVAQGRALYVAKGCYQCHGRIGQGATGVGARLAPPRQPVEAFTAYVRRPTGVMPRYSARLLPDAEVAAIHAWLRALPPPRGAAAIPMLAPFAAAAAGRPSGGEAVYRRQCAACHGAEREGASGPRLTDEAARRTVAQTAALIRDPPPKMPRLVPALVSEAEAEAVAAYLHRPRP